MQVQGEVLEHSKGLKPPHWRVFFSIGVLGVVHQVRDDVTVLSTRNSRGHKAMLVLQMQEGFVDGQVCGH